MTKFRRTDIDVNHIAISWIPPIYHPITFQLHISCKKLSRNKGYFKSTQSLQSLSTSFETDIHVKRRSVCKVTLTAIYNPASIDAGITATLHKPGDLNKMD